MPSKYLLLTQLLSLEIIYSKLISMSGQIAIFKKKIEYFFRKENIWQIKMNNMKLLLRISMRHLECFIIVYNHLNRHSLECTVSRHKCLLVDQLQPCHPIFLYPFPSCHPLSFVSVFALI